MQFIILFFNYSIFSGYFSSLTKLRRFIRSHVYLFPRVLTNRLHDPHRVSPQVVETLLEEPPQICSRLRRSISEEPRNCFLQEQQMKKIIYLIHSKTSMGRTLEDEDPHHAVPMKIPLVRVSGPRGSRRPFSVRGRAAQARSRPAAPPHLPSDGTTRAHSDDDSRRPQGHRPTCYRATLVNPSPSPAQALPPAFPRPSPANSDF